MIKTRYYTTALSKKIPEGQSGKFKIVKTVIRKGALIRTYSPVGIFYHDKYDADFPIIRLIEEVEGEPENTVWMSDTAMEQEAMRLSATVARGDILIIGLGIGLFPSMLKMYNRKVKSITIIEREQDVANLVWEHIRTREMKLVIADGSNYLNTTGDKYDFIFIDIWGGFVNPLKEGELWSAVASRCLKKGGEVRWWMQELHERIKDRLPKEPAQRAGDAAIYPPCLICGKKLRYDYAGLCMDCADVLEISEMFIEGGESSAGTNSRTTEESLREQP